MSQTKISDFYEDLDRVLSDELDAEGLIEALNAELETLAARAAELVETLNAELETLAAQVVKGEDIQAELVELRAIRRSACESRS